MKQTLSVVLAAAIFAVTATSHADMLHDAAMRARSIDDSAAIFRLRTGAVEVALGSRTREALLAYQIAEGLAPTGVFDVATAARIGAMANALAKVRGAATPRELTTCGEVQGDDAAVDVLLAVASTSSEGTRLTAVDLLSEIRSARSRATLGIVMHENGSASVRLAATRALANIGDAQSLYAIALASESESDLSVRATMTESLEAVLPLEAPLLLVEVPPRVELLSDAR